MAAIAGGSGASVRRRRLAACAASAVMAAALAVPGGASATPATPVVTATQSGPLKVQLTSSTGTHWSWTFLNAAMAVVGTSALQNPLQAFPQAGDYTAMVDATDDDTVATAPARGLTTFHVYNTPTASFTYTVLAGGTVQFTDTSTGEPASWQWAFPSGTYSGRTPPAQVIPARTPPWPVTLTVTNPAGSGVVSVPVVVNGPPVAALKITPNPVAAKTRVTLNASASTDPNGDALKYSWDLNGDKTYGDATGAIQTRTFASPGTYRVGVRVTDPSGSSNDAVDFVTVLQDKPPVVTLSASPTTPAIGAPVTFTATARDPDGTVAAIDWDIDGDGAIRRRHGRRRDTELRHIRLPSRVRARHGQRGRDDDRLPDDRGDRIVGGPIRRRGEWRPHQLGVERQAGDAQPVPGRAHPRRDPPRVRAPQPAVGQGARGRQGEGDLSRARVPQEEVPRVARGIRQELRARAEPRTATAQRRGHRGVRHCARADRQVHEVHHPFERRARASRPLPAAGQVETRRVPRLIVLAAQLGQQELRVHRADEVA